jgi:sugar/nucleoside kinase (ribokinase family)
MFAGVGSVEVVAVGHAIVDVLAHVDDGFVAARGLEKGTMTLVDDEASGRILAALGPVTTVSGGSAANTAAALASLGRRAAFVGKVSDDELGRAFASDIRDAGVRFEVAPATSGPGTGRSLILVTPDAEKTMCTSLGIGDMVGPGDVDTSLVAGASVVYVEGYLCGLPDAEAALAAVLDAAAGSGTTVALSLSDPSWVDLHGAELAALLGRAGVVFANEDEARRLTGAACAEDAVDALAAGGRTAVVTRGPAGCLAGREGERVEVPAVPVARVVDTTGAGDSFAAGFLHGLLRSDDLEAAARLGHLAAGEVVGHLGARPLRPLAGLAAGAGLG